MFMTKPPPPPPPEANGITFELKLSEATLLKLVSIALAALLGSGVWVAQSTPSPSEVPDAIAETTP